MTIENALAHLDRAAQIEIERGMDGDEAIERGLALAHWVREARTALEADRAARHAAVPATEWQVIKAALALLWAIDERHDGNPAPLKYTVPWGAVNNLRRAFNATGESTAAPSLPVAGEQQPSEQDRIDAKRYRVIRAGYIDLLCQRPTDTDGTYDISTIKADGKHGDESEGRALDAFCDAAIQASGGSGNGGEE